MRLLVACTVVSAALSVAAPRAHAQSNKAAAEVLFEEGRKLLAEGKIAEACARFESSEQLDASSGTLLNLANCYEKQGRTASAWQTYKEAASVASSSGRSDHLAVAQKRATGLAPNLARVTLMVTEPAEGGEVRCDGAVVPRAQWGVSVPMDPGTHACTASAPRHRTWNGTVEVPASGAATLTVTVPKLDALPLDATVAEPATGPVTTQVVAGTHASASSSSSGTQKIVAVTVGGVGLAGVVVGGVLGLAAKSTYDESLRACPNDKDLCTADGVNQRNDARGLGTASTVVMIAGGAALAAGIVLWVTAPSSSTERSVALVPTLRGALLRGTF